MHELALAEGVIVTALERAKAQQRRLCRVVVRVGELQQIDTEVFDHCLAAVRPVDEPLLEATRIEVTLEPAALRCRTCATTYGFADLDEPPGPEEREAIHFVPELAHAWIRCPRCASPDFEVTAGRGVHIEASELMP